MSFSQQPRPLEFEKLVGYSHTIRENLWRIEVALPLIPLQFSSTPAGASEPIAATTAPATETLSGRGSTQVPPPKGLLAPGGRIPVAKSQPVRRTSQDNAR